MSTKRIDNAIAFALANYAAMAAEAKAKEESEKGNDRVINLSGDKPAKVRKAKAAKEEKKAAEPAPEKVLDAETSRIFLLAIKAAGMRPNEYNVLTRDFTKIKEDEKAALKQYCGYFAVPHGIQLDNASRRAKMLVNPSLGQDRKRVDNTVRGFVAGLPDHNQKQIQDLLARERIALSEMSNPEEKEEVKLLAEARLVPIHEELSSLGYIAPNCSPPLTSKIEVSWNNE